LKEVPSVEVTVCGTEPVFVQQTVVPGATVKALGVNMKSAIVTWVSPASHVALGLADAWPNVGSTPKNSANALASADNPSGSPRFIPTAQYHTGGGLEFQISGCRNVRSGA
jgi:hypothetical protein